LPRIPRPLLYLVEPTIIIASKSALDYVSASFYSKYFGKYPKTRAFLRFLLAMAAYALPIALLYAYAISEYGTIRVPIYKYLFSIDPVTASILTFLFLWTGLIIVVKAFASFLAYPILLADFLSLERTGEIIIRRLRLKESSLFAWLVVVISVGIIYLYYPIVYTIFAFTTMHFLARFPLVIGYELLRGSLDGLVIIGEYIGRGFYKLIPENYKEASLLLDLPHISAQAIASYLMAIVFFAAAIVGGILVQEYLAVSRIAALNRLFIVLYTFAIRVKLDRLRKVFSLTFVSALIRSEASERLKAYVSLYLRTGHENLIKATVVILSAIVNVLIR